MYKTMLKEERTNFDKIIQIIGQKQSDSSLKIPSQVLNNLRAKIAEEMIIDIAKKLN